MTASSTGIRFPAGESFPTPCRIGLPPFVEKMKADHTGPHEQKEQT